MKFKKALASLLVITSIFGFTACGTKKTETNEKVPTNQAKTGEQ